MCIRDRNIGGVFCTLLAFAGLAVTVWGVYLLIIQLASIGDILKRYHVRAYYKNIVFYNLLKQKIRQYTRSIFAAALLITFTIFGIGFIAAGFVDGYNVALNEPYDYTIYTTADKQEMTEKRIYRIAEDSNAEITKIIRIDSLLLGVENTYKDGSSDWSSRVVISQSNFNQISGLNIVVPEGSYTLYYDKMCIRDRSHSVFPGPGCLTQDLKRSLQQCLLQPDILFQAATPRVPPVSYTHLSGHPPGKCRTWIHPGLPDVRNVRAAGCRYAWTHGALYR